MRVAVLLVAVCAASMYVVAFGLGEGQPGLLAHDVYAYYYPNALHALRSLADGGQGLLWNPFQNCGQSFFPVSSTGLLYPLNIFFLLFVPETALRVLMFTNLVIGGLGAYGLGRQLGVSPLGSIGAALAFTLSSAAYHTTTWMPTVQGPYVWMPVAMLCCERLVRAPSLPGALLLGMSLAAGLLPGHPQFVLFTCQLVGLRLLWSLFDGAERRNFGQATAAVGLALIVMLLLTAAQYVASLEVIGESIRRSTLGAQELAPRGFETLEGLALNIIRHESLAPFSIVPGFIAAAALVGPSRRRIALFYFLAGLLFLTLSFGLATPLGELYYLLPGSSAFREPLRFRFVTGFCVSVLTGLAIDVLGQGSWRALAVSVAALAGLSVWLRQMWPQDLELAAAVLGGGLLAAAVPAARPIGTVIIVAAIALAPVIVPHWTTQRFLADDWPLRVHADVLERLHTRLTPQDRVQFALPPEHTAGLEEKTATLFELPSITDSEPQLSERYAQFVVMLRRGELLRAINQVYFPGVWNPRTMRWPLVNLAAGRYLVIDKSHEQQLDPDQQLSLTFLDGDDRISVYENAAALPRAYYVPQISVEPDPMVRIRRLARKGDRRRQALVDTTPASGFLGVPGNEATAEARFVVDDPEHVVLETVAPERGFLFLADQYFPAWSATVNGAPAPILIGNHAFRLVEVPSGPVTVEFRYRTHRVWIGAIISGLTLVVVGAVLIASLRRARIQAVQRPVVADAASLDDRRSAMGD